jgi:site-specific recombinase XerD
MSRRQTRLERLRNIFFIDLLRFTAARPAELLQLTDDSITADLEGLALTIHGIKQKGKPRPYKLKGYAKDSYLNYIQQKKAERPTEKKLFVSMSKRDGWTHQGVNQLMKRLSKELGFRVNCYGFRRSVATSLDEMGLSLDEIGTYLGHTRRSTTLRYIQESTKRTAKASDIMDKIY